MKHRHPIGRMERSRREEELYQCRSATLVGGVQTPWRRELHRDFERALTETNLPERPDCEAANRFLIRARRHSINVWIFRWWGWQA